MINDHKIQVLETVVILFLYVSAFFITKTIINNALKSTQLQRSRRKIIIKVAHLFIFIAATI